MGQLILSGPLVRTYVVVCATLLVPSASWAQRELHWPRIDVEATLAGDGTLRVDETQTIVFSGDWNGGERRFDIRPRQTLSLLALARASGSEWRSLSLDSSLDDLDEYAWTDASTLRWRSRLPGAPPFRNAEMRYLLRYELSNILIKDSDTFVLDHDFLFPDRAGLVRTFALRLTLDPAWQPLAEVRTDYRANDVRPGRGFVLTIPMRFVGVGTPATLDTTRPPHVVASVVALLVATPLMAVWLITRERRLGRFAPAAHVVDEAFLAEHVFKHPAEVIGAAWDENVGAPEVVALLARLVQEGKLTSTAQNTSMSLHLNVHRDTLQGYERTLIDRLFFDGGNDTSSDAVKEHYRQQGFRPANDIRSELEAAVDAAMPGGPPPRSIRYVTRGLLAFGAGLLLWDMFAGDISVGGAVATIAAAMVLIAVGYIFGSAFQTNVTWGTHLAVTCLVPALLVVLGVSYVLWFHVGLDRMTMPRGTALAIAAFALAMAWATVNAMKSRRPRAAIAYRRALAAAHDFFEAELAKDDPALREEWGPWILAFGLGPRVQHWSSTPAADRSPSSTPSSATIGVESPRASSAPLSWTGFGRGRSGGAGGGASWTTAASGLAAGFSAAASRRSDRGDHREHSTDDSPNDGGWRSGGGSPSSGGSHSSGGSSGGGGGGGW